MRTTRLTGALAMAAALLFGAQALAQGAAGAGEAAGQDHTHAAQAQGEKNDVYGGYFEDAQIADRSLSDWEGDWQSVYPYLTDGALDAVMAHKAEHGDKSAEDYRAYYETGYATDIDRIVIAGDRIVFYRDGEPAEGRYAADGHEILTYEAGNRGVRFIFRKTEGDAAAPSFIQFSDHRIAPEASDHYHLYMGADRAALLEELTNWPTYYPATLSAEQIAEAMMAH